MLTQSGYQATRDDDGVLTVHRVPIFVECERGEVSFDRAWIESAVNKARLAESEGYLPPLHIRHHEASTEANNSVRASGYFRILGTEQIRFKGSPRLAILADLVITDPATQQEILSKRLPYRSVEIFDVNKPAIDGLALLDHEAPFLELPMLMVSQLNETSAAMSRVAPATLDLNPADTVAACFRRGTSANLLFRDEQMADEDKKDEDKGENMESAAVDVGAICKAIKDGSISVADMKEIMAAIQEQTAGSEDEAPEADAETPAPASAPSGETMKSKEDKPEIAAKFAALAGEIDGLKARNAAIEAEAKRKDQVAVALKRLEGRPLGADIEKRLFKAHKEHGPAAFDFYVSELEKAVAPLPADEKPDFRAASGKVPAVAMKYQDAGPAAVEAAMKHCADWELLKAHRATSLTQERYVELSMKDEVN